MNSTVFILGGILTLENVKINNQSNSMWASPLVLTDANVSDIIVNLHSCIITNSIYENVKDHYMSAVVYFNREHECKSLEALNISLCLCYNNSFNSLISLDDGGFCYFNNNSNDNSSMAFFFFFFFFF
jgi:hypothetical protein